MRHRLAVAGVGVLGLMVLMALLAPWNGRYSPIELDLAAMSQPPSAAHWLGTDTMVRHMFPSVVGTVTAAATFGEASAILQEAALSFLGLGVQAPTPSWRNMLRDAQTLTILEGMPWLWLAPGPMIALAVLSINFIGDGLRDALDPRPTL